MATTAVPPVSAPADERVRRKSLGARLLSRPEIGALIALVLVWVFFAIVAHQHNFISWATTASVLNTAAPLGIIAVAVALLMIAGEFDLSVGSIIGFAGMSIMLLVTPSIGGGFGWPLVPALIVSLVLSLLIGAFNGTVVLATKLPSFIVTLGTLFVFRGLTIAITRLKTSRTQLGGLDQISGFSIARKLFGSNLTLFGSQFSVAILWWLVLTIIATWILLRTRAGNWIFGTGGAVDAARNVGVPTRRVKVALFMTTAFAAWLVAVIEAVQFTGADVLRGENQEFQAIIAAVVGGCLLTGGYGSAIGASLGALIFALVQQGIVVTGVDADWFQVFIGGILLGAVMFNNFIRRRAALR
ncbi:MAG TPA: ABC transporter permease [Actinomycetota bacterium]|jgi:simple sugar transport system permease protein